MKILILSFLIFSLFLTAQSFNDTTGSALLARDRVQDGLKPLVKFVHFFLHKIVQPKKIDVFLDRINAETYNDFKNYFKDTNWKTIVKDMSKVYLGFAIITLLGVLTVLGLLISVFITCCCRCCCSKKPKFDNEGKYTCKRTCCGFVLFTISIFCVGLCVVGALAGTHLAKELKAENFFVDIETSGGVINNYISTTKSNLTNTVTTSIGKTETNVNGLLTSFPTSIFSKFNSEIGDADKNLKDILITSSRVELDLSYESLEDNSTVYKAELKNLEDSINLLNTAIKSSCEAIPISPDCDEMKNLAKNIKPNANFSNLAQPDATTVISATLVKRAKDEINGTVQKYFEIRERTLDQAQNGMNSAKREVTRIAEAGRKVANDLEKKLNFKVDIKFSPKTKSNMDKVSKIIFYSLIGIAGLLGIVGAFFIIGLVCGGICPQPKKIGCCECFSSHFGANIIWVGAIIFFIFGWLLLLLTTSLFLSGGIIEDNVCRHLRDRDPALDRIGNLAKKSINVDVIKNSTLNFTGLLNSLEKKKAIYEALELSNFPELNINKMLDLSNIKKLIEEQLSNITVDLSGISVLPPNSAELQEAAQIFDEIEIKRWLEESNKVVLEGDLLKLKQLLDNNLPAFNPALTHLNAVITINQSLTLLKDNIQRSSEYINNSFPQESLAKPLDNLNMSSIKFNESGTQILQGAIRDTSGTIFSYTEKEVTDLITAVTKEVGTTGPIWNIFLSLRRVSCDQLLNSLNNYWFCLGWTSFFYLLAMGFAIGMADLFRISKDSENVFDSSNSSDFNSIPMNSRNNIYTTENGLGGKKPRALPRQTYTVNDGDGRRRMGRIQEHYI